LISFLTLNCCAGLECAVAPTPAACGR